MYLEQFKTFVMLTKYKFEDGIAVFYDAELQFLIEIFKRCRVQVDILERDVPLKKDLDKGLRSFLGYDRDILDSVSELFSYTEDKVIYRMTDSFMCSYMFMRLPETESETLLMAGPYLTVELSSQEILELAEKSGIPPQHYGQFEKYYAHIPILVNESPLHAVLDSFATKIWGGEAFRVEDINRELIQSDAPLPLLEEALTPEQISWNMKLLEERYAHENELIQAVANGLSHKAELLLSGFSSMVFEKRLADPVRNIKNYCIIMNTLLRKAAESGGVHPLYLDRTSSDFAIRIERLTSTDAAAKLMDEIFRAYCRLVNRHSTKKYSAPVRKVIIQIDSNLGGDLSLKALADSQNINASYLSSLFKKETGQTVTDFINERRIKSAARLLRTTNLEIQSISHHCGFLDANYFSKIFKKYTGKTPKEYRKTISLGHGTKKAAE